MANYILSQPGYIPPSFERLLWDACGDDIHELSVPIGDCGIDVFFFFFVFCFLYNNFAYKHGYSNSI